MTGISEILVLVLLITCILILPRLLKGEPARKVASSKKITKLGAKTRFSIILTIIYPVVMALYLKPWNDNFIVYISYGILPVFLCWSIVWVLSGKKR
ncbi:hypothetical protein [Desulfobacula toluolica]|uniref:Conserved uncharacterized protein n=1 Tax=Desulfobacula toluolica (strain DSM 7467 / Tol2) TaxID=651182 RepID=K0N8Y2_DESTT|nr:hypothetical protein [Desulfobacula toluolica]CCK80389.1 conserved uncharacterized protein [Desulfobacula toluolica Tol2]